MKLGVLGAGHISEVVAPTWVSMEGIECYAVSSRSLEKAEAFAKYFESISEIQELISVPSDAFSRGITNFTVGYRLEISSIL